MCDISESVRALLDKSPFIRFLGIELLSVDQKQARGRMPFAEQYQNPYGSMHGGSLYALADTIAGTLANMCGNAVTTVDGTLHFLAPALHSEYIYCDATLRKSGSHLITVNVNITDDQGKLLDCGCFTYYRTEMVLAE
ncbi:MAG: PaaI family thioesterase [Lachnospiraceae bacterium]|nr:PaaI family thioesterase [Lachnospiraceae bacterium]